MATNYSKREIAVNDINLYTEHFGDSKNPACVLIAGAMSSAYFWSDNFCNKIADAGYFVIRYDNRDIGLSSGVDWKVHPYSLKELAHDAIGILNAYSIKKAHFIGHSMGGYVCQELALDFPERVCTITIISAGPLGATPESENLLTSAEQKILQNTWDLFLTRKDANTIEGTAESFMPVWKHLNGTADFDETRARGYTLDLLKRTHHPIKAGNNHELVMRRVHETMAERKNILARIHVPTLIIYGKKDFLVLPREPRALCKAIKESECVALPTMGHVFFSKAIEDQIIKHIIMFLNKH